MRVHPSGYYAWKFGSVSLRQKDDQRLLGLIKQSWLESGGVYGYHKIVRDLRDLGEFCGKHRVYRLMKQEGIAGSGGVPPPDRALWQANCRCRQSAGAEF